MWDDSEESKVVKVNKLKPEEMHFLHHSKKYARKISGDIVILQFGYKNMRSVLVTSLVCLGDGGEVFSKWGRRAWHWGFRLKNQEVLFTEN